MWTVVLGEFDRSGDTLRLAARVVDVASGKQVDLARVEAPAGDEVRPLFDQLAAQLLDISGAPQGERVGLAQATTRSVEAYRAYLAGDGALNHWDLPAAEASLRKAIAADSTFGLAYYKLAVTRGWMHGGEDSIGANAIARAEAYCQSVAGARADDDPRVPHLHPGRQRRCAPAVPGTAGKESRRPRRLVWSGRRLVPR